MRYEGTDTAGLLALVAAGHGLAVLPTRVAKEPTGAVLPARVAKEPAGAVLLTGVAKEPAAIVAVPLVSPRLTHRTELLHGTITGTAAELLAATLAG
jgi:DNA-binding transcriptional LysR family regulator